MQIVDFLKKRRHFFVFEDKKALLGNLRALRHFFARGGHWGGQQH